MSAQSASQNKAAFIVGVPFVPQPKPSSDPLIIKRERMVARLEDQKKLLADPNFVRTVK
jgi:hypothetical protein